MRVANLVLITKNWLFSFYFSVIIFGKFENISALNTNSAIALVVHYYLIKIGFLANNYRKVLFYYFRQPNGGRIIDKVRVPITEEIGGEVREPVIPPNRISDDEIIVECARK